MLLLSVVLFLGSCAKESAESDEPLEEQQSSDIEFPTLQNLSVVVGEEYTLTYGTAVDWSATRDVTWIEFRSNGESYSSITGYAGESSQITFAINDNGHDFVDDYGNITLHMDGQEAVIATLTRCAKDKSVSLYWVDPDSGEEVELSGDQPLGLTWSAAHQNFGAQLRLVTSFDWSFGELSAWIDTSSVTSSGSADEEYFFRISTSYEGYTDVEQMDAVVDLLCSADPQYSYPITMVAAGAKGLMVVTSEIFDDFCFDADATYASLIDGSLSDSYSFNYIAEGDQNSVALRAVSSREQWAEWVHLEQTQLAQCGDLLSQLQCDLSVDVNSTTQSREATIFILPSSLAPSYQAPSDFYADDGGVKSELEGYIAGVVDQSGINGVELEFTSEDPTREATLTRMDSSHPCYSLFVDDYSVPVGSLFVLEYPSSSIVENINYPFDFNLDRDGIKWGNISTPAADQTEWLSVKLYSSYFSVAMNSSISVDGYIILEEDQESSVAIYCTLKL